MAPKFEMTSFAPKAKENDWIEPIAALAEATDKNTDEANVPGIVVFIDWKGRNSELLKIREAAKRVNKTVRIRTEDESALEQIGTKDNGKKIFQGEIRYELFLTDKYKDGRGRKPKGADEAGEAGEAVEASEAADKSKSK